jgi:hypothetical protein
MTKITSVFIITNGFLGKETSILSHQVHDGLQWISRLTIFLSRITNYRDGDISSREHETNYSSQSLSSQSATLYSRDYHKLGIQVWATGQQSLIFNGCYRRKSWRRNITFSWGKHVHIFKIHTIQSLHFLPREQTRTFTEMTLRAYISNR